MNLTKGSKARKQLPPAARFVSRLPALGSDSHGIRMCFY